MIKYRMAKKWMAKKWMAKLVILQKTPQILFAVQ